MLNVITVMLVIVAMVILDTLAGVLVAIRQRNWNWHRVADFLETAVLPQVGGPGILAVLAGLAPSMAHVAGDTGAWAEIVGAAIDGLPAVFYAAAAASAIKLLADIAQKITALGIEVKMVPVVKVDQITRPPGQ